jgi:hypothetical protein
LYGTAACAESLHRSFDALRAQIDHRPETLAWMSQGAIAWSCRRPRIGAAIRCWSFVPVRPTVSARGLEFAGTYSLGGAQITLVASVRHRPKWEVHGHRPVALPHRQPVLEIRRHGRGGVDTRHGGGNRGAAELLARLALLLRGMWMTLSLRCAGVPAPQRRRAAGDFGTPGRRWRLCAAMPLAARTASTAMPWRWLSRAPETSSPTWRAVNSTSNRARVNGCRLLMSTGAAWCPCYSGDGALVRCGCGRGRRLAALAVWDLADRSIPAQWQVCAATLARWRASRLAEVVACPTGGTIAGRCDGLPLRSDLGG